MSDANLSIAIPDNLEACQALIARQACVINDRNEKLEQQTRTIDNQTATLEQYATTIEELHQRKRELEQEKEDLRLAYVELLRRAFRRRSERYLADPNQLKLDFGNTEDAEDAAEGLALAVEETRQVVPAHTRRAPRKRRHENLPDHLPRREVEAEVPEDVKNCPKHGPRKVIGYDTTETLQFERPQLWVLVTKYPKFACEASPECGVASPERPTGLVEGNRYDTSVAAEIITGKYGYHLPVYRQQDYFAGSGWLPGRSTLLNLLTASAFVIRPLVEHFKQVVADSGRVGTDETRVTLLLPKEVPKLDPADPKSVRMHEVFGKAIAQGKPSVSGRMWADRTTTTSSN